MGFRSVAALFVSMALAGCAAPPVLVDAPSRGSADTCLALFQEFDRWEQVYPAVPREAERMVEHPMLERQGQRLLRAGCITTSRDLDRMAVAPGTPVAEGGALIRPIALHAGVLTSIVDEVRLRNHFAEKGVRVRTVGQGSLGRRVYLGPFATEGGLATAAQAAREAGFVAPYPKFF